MTLLRSQYRCQSRPSSTSWVYLMTPTIEGVFGHDTRCSISRPSNSVGYMTAPAVISITPNPGELYGR
ncbi:MAG: hypothetical protein QF675_06210 [SAR324 cluster bacterium]|nr:hypothetical protein [SAR324 cluster bacterium]